MSKVKLYVEPITNYYKLKFHKDSNKDSPGVLFYKKHRFSIREAQAQPFENSAYKDRLVLRNRASDPSYKYYLDCTSEEEAFKILNELYGDVELIAPKERINQVIKLPVDLVTQLKEIVKNPEGFDGEVKEYPISDHVLQWIKKVK